MLFLQAKALQYPNQLAVIPRQVDPFHSLEKQSYHPRSQRHVFDKFFLIIEFLGLRIEFFGLRLIFPIREPIDLHALFFDQGGIDQRFPVTTPDHDVLETLADLHGLLVHSVISHQRLYPKVKKVPITNQRHGIGLCVDQGIVRVLPNQLEPISILNQGWRTGLIEINSFQAQFCHFTPHNIVCMSLASSRKPDRNYSLHPVHLVRSNRYRSVDTQVFFVSIGKNRISRTLRITKSHLGGVITFV